MIYRQGFGISWDYTTDGRLAWPPSLSLAIVTQSSAGTESFTEGKREKGEELLEGYLVLRLGRRLSRQSECPSGKCLFANRETSVCLRQGGSCCFCTQTSTSHYQLAGQSANSFDRLVGWMEGEYRNSTEGRRKVSPVQADPGQCCLNKNKVLGQCLI